MFDFYLFYRYSGMLESGAFRNRPADYLMLYFFSCTQFLFWAYVLGLQFLSTCVSTMMLYIWARKNPNFLISFFDVFQFRSCFLPLFMLGLIFLFGFDPTMDIIGSLVGHLYYYLDEVVPRIPDT